MFKIATWNVNSLRVRLPQVLEWLQVHSPDVLAIQETKMCDDDFPAEAFKAAGYFVDFSGQKTYNGVAIVSRMPMADRVTDFPHVEDPQRRILGVTINGIRILNLYVPNGASVDSDKYQYKLAWMSHLADYVTAQRACFDHLILLGDFNVAPEDRDVYDPVAWEGQVLVSPAERAALEHVKEQAALVDTLRLFEQGTVYSWWDYRAAGFRRNQGLRIDHIFATPSLAKTCISCQVDKIPRKAERPSDHAPVVAEFEESNL